MKKKKIIILLVAFILICIPLFGWLGYRNYIKANVSKVLVSGDYEYKLLYNAVYIVKYNGSDEVVEIPEELLFRPVYKIEKYAFEGNKTVREVIIPDTVSEIDNCAFKDCTSLEKINFPFGLERIGASAFSNCVNLKEAEINFDSRYCEEGVILPYAFENCSSLIKMDFHGCNVSVCERAFINCINLQNISGADKITMCKDAFDNTGMMNDWNDEYFYIDDCLIKYLGDETDIIVPDRFNSISEDAFSDYDYGKKSCEIKSITIPDNITCLTVDLGISYTDSYEKVKLYFGRPSEFSVAKGVDADKNFIFVAPTDSVVIQYAREHGIEYIVEE